MPAPDPPSWNVSVAVAVTLPLMIDVGARVSVLPPPWNWMAGPTVPVIVPALKTLAPVGPTIPMMMPVSPEIVPVLTIFAVVFARMANEAGPLAVMVPALITVIVLPWMPIAKSPVALIVPELLLTTVPTCVQIAVPPPVTLSPSASMVAELLTLTVPGPLTLARLALIATGAPPIAEMSPKFVTLIRFADSVDGLDAAPPPRT